MRSKMEKYQFDVQVETINGRYIIRIPKDVSMQLSSRGMVMVNGFNMDREFEAVLEPDGMGGHWFFAEHIFSDSMNKSGKISDSIIIVEKINWSELKMPADIKDAIIDSGLSDQWDCLTTKARWDWIRWIRFTNNPVTRMKRIGVACSMLHEGKKRPCCFDRTRCTDTSVSRNGVLNSL